MIRVFFGLLSILICGAIFAAVQLGVSSETMMKLAKDHIDEAASDLIPEVQLEVIVVQMQRMCPVQYDDKITLVNVTSGPGLQINAHYQLDTQRTTISPREQAAFRTLAIDQFSATGLAGQLVGQKLQWKFIYESASGVPLFDLTLTPEDFLASSRQQGSTQPGTGVPFNASSAGSRPGVPSSGGSGVKAVPLSQVNDVFFESGSAFGGRSRPSSRTTTSVSAPRMQANPFAK